MDITTVGSLSGLKDQLSDLLINSVESGASVGFLPPLKNEDAQRYWDTVDNAILNKSLLVLLATEAGRVLGAVQLAITDKPNGRHRGEVQKLMVHTDTRGKGLGKQLMLAIEQAALDSGRSLLVLDTRKDDVASALYRKIGYIEAGQIPGFARSANGELHTTCYFYKQL